MLEPYNYTFDPDTNYYTFITKNNIEYKVAFFQDFMLESCTTADIKLGNVFQITVEKSTDKPSGLDACVSETIRAIVVAFFQNVDNALIYICDDDDEKGQVRFNAFERWYLNSTMTDCITKINNVVEIELDDDSILKIHTSIMFHNNNTNSENIKITYNSISQFFTGDFLN